MAKLSSYDLIRNSTVRMGHCNGETPKTVQLENFIQKWHLLFQCRTVIHADHSAARGNVVTVRREAPVLAGHHVQIFPAVCSGRISSDDWVAFLIVVRRWQHGDSSGFFEPSVQTLDGDTHVFILPTPFVEFQYFKQIATTVRGYGSFNKTLSCGQQDFCHFHGVNVLLKHKMFYTISICQCVGIPNIRGNTPRVFLSFQEWYKMVLDAVFFKNLYKILILNKVKNQHTTKIDVKFSFLAAVFHALSLFWLG